MLGGPDILTYLVMALGGAMVVGSIGALVRPPDAPRDGDLEQAPVVRSIVFAIVGAVAALWALGSLVLG